jgi:CDP-glucose 4,6-dehydratase
MENLDLKNIFWKGKSVFLTGHTGFKGGWLSLWLSSLGAEVHGYSLDPLTEECFFKATDVQSKIASSTIGDINNVRELSGAMILCKPEIIIHMAAQPLVRESYKFPIETLNTNIIGTANIFNIARDIETLKVVINVTTDKCYENKEWLWPYRENEPLGGFDPYSASKACSEIITSAYRKSFFNDLDINIASVRAGNVIGGGDWSKDRLIPDCLRAIQTESKLLVRFPGAVRPWQHVLEPLSGYIALAEALYKDGSNYNEAWNFGPDEKDVKSVEWIANYLAEKVDAFDWLDEKGVNSLHESLSLRLDSSKAKNKINWFPRWSIVEAIDYTLEWHNAYKNGRNMTSISLKQIQMYENKVLEG